MSGSLSSRRVVRDLLERFGLRPDRGYGQNFLVDGHALSSIVAAADPGPEDTVLEVGPGLGTLTVELAARAQRVLALEADPRLAPVLAETLAAHTNIELRFVDALTFDLNELPSGSLLVANLPYNVGTAMLLRALESQRFARMVVLIQREVAERLVASPGEAAFGSLSLFAQHHARIRIVRHVGPGSFDPAPQVTSSVVRLDIDSGATAETELFVLVRRSFAHRRKTLVKGLTLAGYDREQLLKALDAAGIDRRSRAERLTLADFRSLQRALTANAHPKHPPG